MQQRPLSLVLPPRRVLASKATVEGRTAHPCVATTLSALARELPPKDETLERSPTSARCSSVTRWCLWRDTDLGELLEASR